MRVSIKTILFCFLSLAASYTCYAQDDEDEGGGDGDYSNYNAQVNENKCLQYFYDPKDSSKAFFKMVSETKYGVDDSTMKDKRFVSKTITTFNEKGQQLFNMEVDSNMNVTDSVRMTYNADFKVVKEATYRRNDSSGIVKLSKIELKTYDKKGNVVKDSIYMVNDYSSRYYGRSRRRSTGFGTPEHQQPDANITTTYSTYDTAGNDMIDMTISNALMGTGDVDTVYSRYAYDKKNRKTAVKRSFHDFKMNEYYNYDDNDNVTFSAKVSIEDSTTDISAYDAKSILIAEKKYKDTALTYSFARSTDSKTGNITETEDREATNYGSYSDDVITKAPSCPNNTVTVSVYDSNMNLLSSVETRYKAGKPFVTTTMHKYTFDKAWKVMTDSVTVVEAGHLYAMSSQEVTASQYDKFENEVEHTEKGGGRYTNNSRWTRKYNEHNKMVEMGRYNSCVADKPELHAVFTYYKGDERTKEIMYTANGAKTVMEYSEDSMEKKMDYISDKSESYELVFEYQK